MKKINFSRKKKSKKLKKNIVSNFFFFLIRFLIINILIIRIEYIVRKIHHNFAKFEKKLEKFF